MLFKKQIQSTRLYFETPCSKQSVDSISFISDIIKFYIYVYMYIYTYIVYVLTKLALVTHLSQEGEEGRPGDCRTDNTSFYSGKINGAIKQGLTTIHHSFIFQKNSFLFSFSFRKQKMTKVTEFRQKFTQNWVEIFVK